MLADARTNDTHSLDPSYSKTTIHFANESFFPFISKTGYDVFAIPSDLNRPGSIYGLKRAGGRSEPGHA